MRLTPERAQLSASRRVWALALLGSLGLACTGLSDPEVVPVVLTEPWLGLGLPLEDGVLIASAPDAVTIQHSAGEVSDHLPRYQRFLEEAGCEVFYTDRSADALTTLCRDGSAQYALVGARVAGTAMVTIGIGPL